MAEGRVTVALMSSIWPAASVRVLQQALHSSAMGSSHTPRTHRARIEPLLYPSAPLTTNTCRALLRPPTNGKKRTGDELKKLLFYLPETVQLQFFTRLRQPR